jgi:hypothetical protein
MRARRKVVWALAALLGATLAAGAYERELNPRSLRDAWFLGKDTTFRSQDFYKDYIQTFPVPETGVHVERIEIVTPFKEMADRARTAPDGYNPVQAEADYKKEAPPLQVKVRLMLTPDFPGHTPYDRPIHLGPIYLRAPDFWREFEFHLEQAGKIEPVAVRGEPFYSGGEYSLLAGADVYLAYDPANVASRPARVVVKTPDGQEVQAEFDLSKLR